MNVKRLWAPKASALKLSGSSPGLRGHSIYNDQRMFYVPRRFRTASPRFLHWLARKAMTRHMDAISSWESISRL